jgi:hypothetical protein
MTILTTSTTTYITTRLIHLSYFITISTHCHIISGYTIWVERWQCSPHQLPHKLLIISSTSLLSQLTITSLVRILDELRDDNAHHISYHIHQHSLHSIYYRIHATTTYMQLLHTCHYHIHVTTHTCYYTYMLLLACFTSLLSQLTITSLVRILDDLIDEYTHHINYHILFTLLIWFTSLLSQLTITSLGRTLDELIDDNTRHINYHTCATTTYMSLHSLHYYLNTLSYN